MLRSYDSTNVSRHIETVALSKPFIKALAKQVSTLTQTPISRNGVFNLVNYVKSVNFSTFTELSEDEAMKRLAIGFTKRITENKTVDIHNILKREIGTIPYDKSIEGYQDRARNTDEDNNQYLVPASKIEYKAQNLENLALPFSSRQDKFPRIAKQRIQNVYLLLDSRYRNLSTDPSVFKWTVVNSSNTRQGSVNTTSDQIHNLINVQFDRCSIPYVETADNVYKKISVHIEEFTSMSVIMHSGNRYHMMFDSEIVTNQIRLTPLINDDGKFRFYTPINILDTITLTFADPFNRVEFEKDRANVTISSLNPTQSLLTFSEPHGVADGELVHLTGYSTLTPVDDAIQIAFINRERGHIVTNINNSVLRIDANLSTVTADVSNLTECFIASRRLIIPIRFEYLIR